MTLELGARIAESKGDRERAIRMLREAVTIEESMRPPNGAADPIKPSHELLGEVLARAGQHAEAPPPPSTNVSSACPIAPGHCTARPRMPPLASVICRANDGQSFSRSGSANRSTHRTSRGARFRRRGRPMAWLRPGVPAAPCSARLLQHHTHNRRRLSPRHSPGRRGARDTTRGQRHTVGPTCRFP